jgi:hypothetical protein
VEMSFMIIFKDEILERFSFFKSLKVVKMTSSM